MDNFDEYLKLRSTVEPPVDTDDTVMFDIVNRTIMPNHITDIIVKDDNLSRNIKYRIQRYFEGVDRAEKSISFRYNTPNRETDESFAKNVIVEDYVIIFEWQVSNKATCKSGIVEYDILFYDIRGYRWHTKPATIKVETGLEYHTLTPKPSYDWFDSWRAEAGDMLTQCREAESKAIQIEGNISVAIDAANRAINSKTLAEQFAQSARLDAERAKAEADKVELIAGFDPTYYYDKVEINNLFDSLLNVHVINSCQRDPSKPDYGIETGPESTILKAVPYTGFAEITLQIEKKKYDAENMSAQPDTAPGGTVIIRKLED